MRQAGHFRGTFGRANPRHGRYLAGILYNGYLAKGPGQVADGIVSYPNADIWRPCVEDIHVTT